VTISRRLLLGVLAPALMALAVVVGLVLSFQVVGELQQQQVLASQVTADTNELTDLARSFVLTRGDRPRRQFIAKSRAASARLTAAAAGGRYGADFARISEDEAIVGSLFERLVAMEGTSSLPPAVSREAEDRLSSQIFIRLRRASEREAALSRGITDAIVATERRIYVLAGTFTLLIALVLTAALLVLRRSVIRSLRVLREGTERIGSGDLDYRIGMASNDELGDLARSFDRMSERLQEVTVSKTDLEEEVRERRRAEEGLRQSLQTTALLLDAAETLAQRNDLREVAQGLAELLLKVTPHKRSIVDVFDKERNDLVVVGSAGEQPFEPGSRWPLEEVSAAAREVMAECRTRVADIEGLPEEERGIAARPYRLRSPLYVPLIQRDETVGLVVLDDPGERREFTEYEIDLVEGIAAQAAVAIENARLFEAEQTRRRRIESLHGVMEAGASSLEVQVSAKAMLDYLAERESFALLTSWLVRGETLELAATANVPAAYGERVSPMPLSASFDVPKVFYSGEPIVVPDVAEGNPEVRELFDGLGVELGAYVVVPLSSRAKTIGVLTMGWKEPRTFTSEDVDFYLSLGHELGVTLENSRLFEVERDIAERLQSALLSLPEELEGVEFADAYHSAMEAARVGGDFYDLFELQTGRVGIVIGDVAGKGLDAAVLTSMVKNTIRAHANEPGKTPSQILGLTNDVVYKSTATEAFATVFFGVLDCASGRLVYSNAGHTTTVLVGGNGAVTGLPVTGPLLGAFENASFDQGEAQLDPDELLFLYTDGLTEARRGAEMYGEERLFEFLSLVTDGTPANVVGEVIRDVIAFTGDRLTDDLAILALKRVEREGGAEAAERTDS
jgi:GAF domain-containing protein/HAMP domain-containing protein